MQEAETTQEAQVKRLAPEKDANVKLAHDMSPITFPTEDHDGEVNIGMSVTVKLPSEAQQRAGFRIDEEYVPALIAQYAGRYKRFQPKVKTVKSKSVRTGQSGQGQNGGEA